MGERHNDKYKIVKDFGGEPLKLTLVLKEEYKDKNYDLYTVCKVIDNETIPLYDETFTPGQISAFYNNPTHYIAVVPDQEVI